MEMTTELYVTLGVIVGIVLLVLVLIWQVRRWRRQTVDRLAQLTKQMRELRTAEVALEKTKAQFSPTDAEPYGELAAQLADLIAHIDEQSAGLRDQRVNLLGDVPDVRQSPWLAWKAPFQWRRLQRQVHTMQTMYAALETDHARARAIADRLDVMGWTIASTARKVQQQLDDGRQQIGQLREHGLHGTKLDDLDKAQDKMRQQLAETPAWVLAGSKEDVLQQAEKSQVVAVHALLKRFTAQAETLVERTTTWWEQYNRAVGGIEAMETQLAATQQLVDSIPNVINLNQIIPQIQNQRAVANNLHSVKERMEVGALNQIISSAVSVQQSALALYDTLQQSLDNLQLLHDNMGQLLSNLLHSMARFSALEDAEEYPLRWTSSMQRLKQLNEQANQLDGPNHRRTPEELQQTAEIVETIQGQQEQLASLGDTVEAEREQLIELWKGPELGSGLQWFRDLEALMPQFNSYHNSNWPKDALLKTLWEDAQNLAAWQRGVVPESRSGHILEEALPNLLAQTRDLVESRRHLNIRIEQLTERLEALTQSEQQTDNRLQYVQNALGQVAELSLENPALAAVTGRALGRLQDKGSKLGTSLAQRHSGTVEKKVREIEKWGEDTERRCVDWIAKLESAIIKQRQILAEQVELVDSIAPVNETIVEDARQLLAEPDLISRQGTPENLAEMATRINSRSQEITRWMAASAALDEQVIAPLHERYNQAHHAREAAQRALSKAQREVPDRRDWPPTDANLEQPLHDYQAAEADWQALQERRNRAAKLAERLDRFVEQYHTIARQSQDAAEQAKDEQAAIKTLEKRMKDLTSRWRSHHRNYSDNPYAPGAIDDLLSVIDIGYRELQQHYLNHNYDYAQTRIALQDLCDRAGSGRIPISEADVIDINGDVVW